MKLEVRGIGVDPGTSSMGMCYISYWGEKMIRDETGQFVMVPQFKILNSELWDLRRTISYTQNPETMGIIRNKYNSTNGNQQQGDLLHLGNNISRMASNKAWIFESFRSGLYGNGEEDVYPPIVSEPQPGFILNQKVDVLMVSHLFPWVVKSIDRSRGVDSREIISKSKKYGIPSDGALSHEERKVAAEEIGRSLLKMTGKQSDITFLNALVAARKRDVPTSRNLHKCHDILDSLLLALEDCKCRHAALMKKLGITANEEVVEDVAAPFSVTINDDDDSDQEALFPKKQRKTRAPSVTKRAKAIDEQTKNKTPSLGKRAKAVNDGFDEQTKKRKAVVPTKPKPRKKARIQEVVEEDTISFEEDTVIPKKVDVSKKYPQLLFMDK